jgi:DNA/RNA endonuclease YhcR with UshA esterase domain
VGASVSILGKVSAYESELEIIPQLASDITLVNPAAEIPWVSLDSLTTSHAGQLVRVRGMLGEPEGFSAGIKIPLLDGSGRVIILFWSNIYQELKPRPVKDMLVEVAGVVNVYNERLEIIPRSALDVVNIDQGE